MGVRNLTTFLEKYSSNEVCYEVSIKDLAVRYREQTGRMPVMIIDGNSMFELLYGRLNWICGGQYKELTHMVKSFVRKFDELGIKLVAIFDGATQLKKREVWIRRRKDRAIKVQDMFSALERNCPIDIVVGEEFIPIINMGSEIRQAMLEMGCEVILSQKECDEEVAEYFVMHKCFAILAQDTDFLIYNYVPFYLSTKYLNLNTMTTLLYDKNGFAKHIDISLDHLPLFATLMGNDVMEYDLVKDFHTRVMNDFHGPFAVKLVKALARFVRQFPTGEGLMQALPTIASRISREHNLLNTLREGILSYRLELRPVEPPNPIDSWGIFMIKLRRKVRAFNFPNILYAVMNGYPYEFATTMEYHEDKRNYAGMLLLPMRQRKYGVMMQNHPNNIKIIKEWYVAGLESLENIQSVEIIFPPKEIVSLPNLLDESIEVKQKSFTWIVSQNFPIENFTSDLEFVFTALILYFLHKDARALLVWEVKVFAATVVELQEMSIADLSRIQIQHIKPHPINLATLFLHAYSIIRHVNAVCGFPIPKQFGKLSAFFDGKLFQKIYGLADGNDYVPQSGSLQLFNKICDTVLGV